MDITFIDEPGHHYVKVTPVANRNGGAVITIKDGVDPWSDSQSPCAEATAALKVSVQKLP